MKKLISFFALTSLLLAGCSKGFQSLSPTSDTASTGGGSVQGGGSTGSPAPTDGSGSTPSTATWDKVNADGIASGGTYSGQLVVYIDKTKQSLLMVLPIPALVPIVAPVEMPDAPGTFLTTFTGTDGSISLAINVPLHYIVRGGSFASGQRLPNGDPLPFVPAGELPGFGIQFPQMPNYRINVYIGVNVAAAFVELPDLGLPIGGIFPVKNRPKTKVVGAIGYVLPKGNYAGGMYLATQIPDEMARLIDQLIRW